jgi:F-type H+-transporting ATPase subunit delta
MESVASRYALALVKLAQETSSVEQLHTQLQTMQTMIKDTPQWFQFLNNPFYSRPQKETFIQTVFPTQTWGTLTPFLRLLLKNHRIRSVPSILHEAIHLCEQALHIKHGVIYVASKLSSDQQRAIENALATHLRVSLQLTQHIDPTLLGGFRVDINGKVYDASVLGKLDALTRHLKQRG